MIEGLHSSYLSVRSVSSVFRDATGKFPEYPGEDDGGSAAIFKEKDPAEVEAELRDKVSPRQLVELYYCNNCLYKLIVYIV